MLILQLSDNSFTNKSELFFFILRTGYVDKKKIILMNNNIHKYQKHSIKSDLQLWNEIRKGNPDALSKLFYRFYEDLFFYGTRLTCNNAHIADTIQDIFLKIWELKNKNSNVTYVKAYIFKIFRNKLLKEKQKSII